MRNPFSILVLLGSILLGTNQLRAQTAGGPVLTIGKILSFYGNCLFASGPQSTNFVLQASPDLSSWTNVFQSYGQPGTNPVYFVTQDIVTTQGFWRAAPGEPLLAQEQRWTNQEPVEYSFYLRHMLSFYQGVRGTVRVLNGTIAGVTNVIDDKTLQPISNPDLSQFLSITQLFEEIRRAFEAGDQQVQVRYDPIGLYPEWILENPLILIADDESEFEVSEFVVLQP
jgi:hypothetical protein